MIRLDRHLIQSMQEGIAACIEIECCAEPNRSTLFRWNAMNFEFKTEKF